MSGWNYVEHQGLFTAMTVGLFSLGVLLGTGLSGSLVGGYLGGGVGIAAGFLIADRLVRRHP